VAVDYQTAKRLHAELQSLAARVLDQKIQFRPYDRVHPKLQPRTSRVYTAVSRDRAICGLTNKAVQTHAAIAILLEAGLANDAIALCRVLMENTFTISWILKDPVFRGDLYCVSSVVYRRRLAELTKQHYTHSPEMQADADRVLADKNDELLATVLDNTWERWARRIDPSTGKLEQIGARGMFHDLGVETSHGKKVSFMYDVPYFQHSHMIHSTIPSLQRYEIRDERYFRLDLKPRAGAEQEALNTANVCMVQTYADFEKYTGADLQPELDTIWDEIREVREQPPDLTGGSA
jgi:hypothetical protein